MKCIVVVLACACSFKICQKSSFTLEYNVDFRRDKIYCKLYMTLNDWFQFWYLTMRNRYIWELINACLVECFWISIFLWCVLKSNQRLSCYIFSNNKGKMYGSFASILFHLPNLIICQCDCIRSVHQNKRNSTTRHTLMKMNIDEIVEFKIMKFISDKTWERQSAYYLYIFTRMKIFYEYTIHTTAERGNYADSSSYTTCLIKCVNLSADDVTFSGCDINSRMKWKRRRYIWLLQIKRKEILFFLPKL